MRDPAMRGYDCDGILILPFCSVLLKSCRIAHGGDWA